jgi:hypothetical protein
MMLPMNLRNIQRFVVAVKVADQAWPIFLANPSPPSVKTFIYVGHLSGGGNHYHE